MSVVIRIGIDEATISGLTWTSSNIAMQQALQSIVDQVGPSGADPYPDYTEAVNAVERFGGTIIIVDDVPQMSERVY